MTFENAELNNNTPLDHPLRQLEKLSSRWNISIDSEEFAKRIDASNMWPCHREKFYYPKMKDLEKVDKSLIKDDDEECIYLCGHSLGLQPKSARDYVNRQFDKWAKIGVNGHREGELPWALCQEPLRPAVARLVGASYDEVDLMNFLTVNLHILMIPFYRPTEKRFKIILEEKAFPSDHYVVESQIKIHGLNPQECMILLNPREGEKIFRTEDITRVIREQGDSVALILLSGVQYFTGQLFDIEEITKVAHEKGCYIGWDLAHAIGNVELKMHDWNADFAAWCSYKYLNSGAGGIGGIFLHERHFEIEKLNKLDGWWSHRDETRFLMNNNMEYAKGAASFALSNPSILLCSCLKASLDLFDEVGLENLRKRSLVLTAYCEYLIQKFVSDSQDKALTMESLTPIDPKQRGAQLSIAFSKHAKIMFEQVEKRGVVCDFREPNVLRFSPMPLYNTFHEIYRFVKLLKESFDHF